MDKQVLHHLQLHLNEMKKILSLTFIVLLLPSMAFAGACPMLTSQVEDKIATLDQTKHATLISIALMLHEQGMAKHMALVIMACLKSYLMEL